MRVPALSLIVVLLCPPLVQSQLWPEFETNIVLPHDRGTTRPHSLLATRDGRLVLAWIAAGDGTDALHAAVFEKEAWSKPERLVDLPVQCDIVLFELNGRVHLLEAGTDQRYYAVERDGKWQRHPSPLPRSEKTRHVSVVEGPEQGVTLCYVRRKDVSDKPGKAFISFLPSQGKAKKQQGLDYTSRNRATHPAVDIDPEGTIHVLLERHYGPGAKPNIVHVTTKKRKSTYIVSRQSGTHPSLAVVAPNEMIAVWEDRMGIIASVYDGRRWNPPTTVLQGGRFPRIHKAGERRIYLSMFQSGSMFFCERKIKGWSMPIDFGTASGAGRVVETPDRTVHVIWEQNGTFVHRVRSHAASVPVR